MGYITCNTQIIFLLVTYISQVFAITTRLDHEVAQSRNFRRHIGSRPFPDWELGLREAVYQALLRERNLHPNLREYLYSAPIIGHQDSATPFGDIVILARGQLYSAPGGFQFVQDPYANDCDECHNAPPRCDRAPCENWKPEGHERILALWTVKRIRHRDSNYGYRYELEYKVTPMNVPVDEPFVTRRGRFDYSMPGHTFIVKSNPREYDSPYQNAHHENVYRSTYESNSWSPNFGPNFEGRYLPPPPLLPPPPPVGEEYFDEDPRSNGYPNVLYGPPQIYTHGRFTTKPPQTYDDEQAEEELFKQLFETKTSTTVRTSLSTASTQNIYTPIMTTKATIPTTRHFLPTINTQTSYHPTSGQAPLLPTIPIQNSVDPTDVFQGKLTTYKDDVIPTKPSSTVRFPTTKSSTSTSYKTVRYSEPDPLYNNTAPATQPTPKFYPTRTTKPFKPTKRVKTTPIDDYDIFGTNDETTEKHAQQSSGMKFPGLVNNRVPPGEQVIKVVNAPTIIPKGDDGFEDIFFNGASTEPNKASPKVSFKDTNRVQPNGESYITIGLRPSTRDPKTTFSTESSSPYNSPTTAVIPQKSSIEPTSTSTTKKYDTVSTEHEEIVTIRSRMREESDLETSSTVRYETVPYTETTKASMSRITETISPTYGITTNPSTSAAKSTKPIYPTKKYFPPTKIYSAPPTKPSTPLVETTFPPTKPRTPPIETTFLPTKPRTTSVETTFPTTPSIEITFPPTNSRTPSVETTFPPTKPKTPSVETTFPSTKPRPTTATTFPSTKTYLPSSGITTSTRGSPSRKTTPTRPRFIPTRPSTRKYKPPTPSVGTTINAETIYTTSTSSRTITDYPTTTDSVSTAITSQATETIKDLDLATSSSFLSTNVPKITYPVPTSTRITDSPTHTTPVSEAPMLPITKTVAPSITRRTKVPSQTSSTTQSSDDIFLQDNKDVHKLKNPKEKPGDEDFELELFGASPEKVTPKVLATKPPPPKESVYSQDEFDDIFSGETIVKKPVRNDYHDYDSTQPVVSPTNKVKIIYSDFFSPSTPTSAERTTKSDFKEESKDVKQSTTMNKAVNDIKNKSSTISAPLTSQSYSTSVSVEVNKINETNEATPKNSSITTPAPCNTTEKHGEKENNKILNMLTLSVVNHAKSIDILNANNDENNNNNNTNNGNNNNNNQTVRERRYKRNELIVYKKFVDVI